ncbi:hypothetical protein LTR36_000139 [Oleoguttula mirabilis]|uniref:Chromo domain-containing protein n=1 Tax=Oleoguttula mirabilis TaxID=1507867 RepID=A0AAV9JYW3_9PEZI|nr:hypothetical protein LTR36_000139 [Oleoguttula mirabilis]
MATNSRPIFAEDSDADSVATDSTQASEDQDTYNVEKILAEDNDYEGNGTTAYLLKWERYPLYEASWEPPENIVDEVLLQQWEQQKRLVRAGKADPYDIGEWDRALESFFNEGVERRRRRKEKRRKRGIPVSPDADNDYEEMDVAEPPKRRRVEKGDEYDSGDEDVIAVRKSTRPRPVQSAPVQRKGVAQRLNGSRRAVESSSDEGEVRDEEDEENDSEFNSLFDAGSQPIYPELAISKKPDLNTTNAAGSRVAAAARAPTSTPKTVKPASTVKAVAHPAARKSAPVPSTTAKPAYAGKTARKTNPNIFANWADQSKKRKQRARVSGETPKDSADPKFGRLSIQNRFQKFSRNEPAPDLNALTIVDPKTGKSAPVPKLAALPPLVVPATATRAPQETHSAYGRRTPPRKRRRSFTPPSPEPRNAQGQVAQLHTHPALGQPIVPSNWRSETCWDYMNGDCRNTAETCRFAHWSVERPQAPPPPPPPVGFADKKLTTCFYWQTGHCNKPVDVCEYAHRDTGIYSKTAHERGIIGAQDRGNLGAQQRGLLGAQERGVPGAHERRQAIAHDSRKTTTCYFWRLDRCNKSADECAYAHYDTGVYAPDPAASRRSLAATGIHGATTMTQSSAWTINPNMEPVSGFPFPLEDNTGVQDTTMTVPSPTAEAGERTVRFQLPQDDRAAPLPAISADSGSLPVRISVESEECGQAAVVDATLEMIGLKKFEGIFHSTSKGVYLFPDRMVTAKDLQTFNPDILAVDLQWPAGSVVPEAASVAMADKLAECCKLHASGFVSIQDRYTLLVYPSNSEEWRFLEITNAPVVPNTSLRFRLCPPIADFDRSQSMVAVSEPYSLQQSASVIVGKALLGLDPSKVLQRPADQKMFIAWPAHRHQELSVLVKYFQDLECKVYHSGTPGAWAYFRVKHGKGSVVIFHPETPLWEIPGLHSFLVRNDAKFFSIGVRNNSVTDEDQQATISCERAFPHGKVVFITDDVFVYHPEKAKDIIESFVKNNGQKPAGGEFDRIAARPGLKDWLRKLAQDQATERGRPDARWLELYESVCKLCPAEAEDPYDLPNPLPSSNLISIPAEELPSFYGLWEQDEEKATDMMVEWFAGWSVLNADKFRRFFVCYEPKGGEIVQDENGRFRVSANPREWSKKYQHIGVQRPGELLQKPKPKK